MGFFYQALKKATGVATDPQEEMAQDLRIDAEQVRHAPAVVTTGARHRKFDIKHPLESLVAFLSAPVEDENIAAMELSSRRSNRLRVPAAGAPRRRLSSAARSSSPTSRSSPLPTMARILSILAR